jgi:hypothetical protein
MTRWTYRLYGLTVATDTPIDALRPQEATDVDVSIRFGPPRDAAEPTDWLRTDDPFDLWRAPGPGTWWAEGGDGRWHRLGLGWDYETVDVVIAPRGEEAWIRHRPDVPTGDVWASVLNPLVACALRLRGTTPLHASVLHWRRSALLIVGPKGAGKSTSAAALAQAGATVMADDIAALDLHDARPRVFAGEPRLRLMPDSAATVAAGGGEAMAIWSSADDRPLKQYVSVVSPADPVRAPDSAPIAAIYVLEPRRAGTVAIEPVAPAAAIPLLMAQRSPNFMPDLDTRAADFGHLTRLAASVPVRRVARATRLDDLPDLASAMLADADALAEQDTDA